MYSSYFISVQTSHRVSVQLFCNCTFILTSRLINCTLPFRSVSKVYHSYPIVGRCIPIRSPRRERACRLQLHCRLHMDTPSPYFMTTLYIFSTCTRMLHCTPGRKSPCEYAKKGDTAEVRDLTRDYANNYSRCSMEFTRRLTKFLADFLP